MKATNIEKLLSVMRTGVRKRIREQTGIIRTLKQASHRHSVSKDRHATPITSSRLTGYKHQDGSY